VKTDELKRHLQGFFTDGLVTVVGLGHSAAHGLPTMPDLADHLRAEMPSRLGGEQVVEWKAVEDALAGGEHLEPALDAIAHDSPVVATIVAVAAECIAAAEAVAIERISLDPAAYPLARLLAKVGFSGKARVITTNYDRLIELAAEIAGFLLDTGFVGSHYGIYDTELSHKVLRSLLVRRPKKFKVTYRPHVVLSKPHGSLDWYKSGETPIRCPYPLDLPRLMITPGESKYRRGYEQPFDHHVKVAYEGIDDADAILAIGFGFNDPHLQTHLLPRIREGLPGLILTRDLTSAAAGLLPDCPNLTALERLGPSGGTRVHRGPDSHELPGTEIWQLGDFIGEVLE
jgi:SIR2-like domain